MDPGGVETFTGGSDTRGGSGNTEKVSEHLVAMIKKQVSEFFVPKTHPHEQNNPPNTNPQAAPPHAVQITLGSEERILFSELLRLLGELSHHLGKSSQQESGSESDIPPFSRSPKQEAGKLQATTSDASKSSVPLYRSRARNPPMSSGPVVCDGIYRISSITQIAGFLELQEDNKITVAALDEASDRQKWEIKYSGNHKYHIRSLLNSRVLSLGPCPSNLNLTIPVGENENCVTHWTIEPRHDTYIIGIANDERVLDVAEDNDVVFRNLNGDNTQRWDLDTMQVQYRPTFTEGAKYMFKNRSTGKILWLSGSSFTSYGYDDGDASLYFMLKPQADGGIAILSVSHGTWAGAELRQSQTEYSYRFLPTDNENWFFICPDMNSHPPTVIQDKPVTLASFDPKNLLQMWQLVRKM